VLSVETTNCMGMFCNVASTRRGGKKLCKSDNHARSDGPLRVRGTRKWAERQTRHSSHPFLLGVFSLINERTTEKWKLRRCKNNGLSSVMHMRRQFFRVLSCLRSNTTRTACHRRRGLKNHIRITPACFLYFMLVREFAA